MSEIIYRKLATELNEIRVLELASGQPDDRLIVSLTTVSLDSTPSPVYEAISYIWGDPEITSRINLCSTDFNITTNLHAALRRFRSPEGTRTLWADAICINQQDLTERGDQVMIMGRIYSQCQQVLIWLGEEEPGDKEGFDFINSSQQVKDAFKGCTSTAWTDPSTCTSIAKYLSSVTEKPWWSRCWTVQELALAPRAMVFCGMYESSWSEFEAAKGLLYRVLGAAPGFCPGCIPNAGAFNESVLMLCRMVPGEYFQADVLTVILLNASRFSSDPRDKIFAFLALSDGKHNIRPNYRSRVEAVYLDFAWSEVKRTKSLQLLSLADSNGQRYLGLPSWVPDWTIPPDDLMTIRQG